MYKTRSEAASYIIGRLMRTKRRTSVGCLNTSDSASLYGNKWSGPWRLLRARGLESATWRRWVGQATTSSMAFPNQTHGPPRNKRTYLGISLTNSVASQTGPCSELSSDESILSQTSSFVAKVLVRR